MGETCSAAITCCDTTEQLPYNPASHVSIQQCYYSTQFRKQVCPGVLLWCTQIKILGGELRHFCWNINTRFKQHRRLMLKLYQWWHLITWENSIQAHTDMCTLTFRRWHLNPQHIGCWQGFVSTLTFGRSQLNPWHIGSWLGFLDAFQYPRYNDSENMLYLLHF